MHPLVFALSLPVIDAAAMRASSTPDVASGARSQCERLPTVQGPRARANPNRAPAGVRRGDTVVVSLVAARAAWYPEAENGCALSVLAFAEEGKGPLVPGPLLRVRAGTVVRVKIRNDAGRTLWVRGLQDRPSKTEEATELPVAEHREFVFTATTSGTYAYGATLARYPHGGPTVRPRREDSQLVGALIVDSRDSPDVPRDRVLMLTRWLTIDDEALVENRADPRYFVLTAVNGRSWPNTERLTYDQGDSVYWRVLNVSGTPHPMHLHGFYFEMTRKGTLNADTALAQPRTLVTESLVNGQTMTIRWRAERPGNWLFHCHLLEHMSAAQRLDRMPAAARAALGGNVQLAGAPSSGAETRPHRHQTISNHAEHGMAGLITGVHVRPARRSQTPDAAAPKRELRLYANRSGVFAHSGIPTHAFVLQDGAKAPAPDSVRLPGSPIVLRRGEPVQITVFNRTMVPLSVHWHGLELDSYFDGVGGWSGWRASVAPPIAPRDSFVVRLTPPRSGTYMYHVHGEDGDELSSGLYAPLIVVDGAPALDTTTDKILLVSNAGTGREDGVLLNGKSEPSLTLIAGRAHRLRIIGITSDFPADLTILDGKDTVQWRPLARDGAELTGPAEPLMPARRRVSPGTTADYELIPARAGSLTLQLRSGILGAPPGTPGAYVNTMTVPVRVVEPER